MFIYISLDYNVFWKINLRCFMKKVGIVCLLAALLLSVASVPAYAKTRIHFSFHVITPFVPPPAPPLVVAPPCSREVIIREYYPRGFFPQPYVVAPYPYYYYPY